MNTSDRIYRGVMVALMLALVGEGAWLVGRPNRSDVLGSSISEDRVRGLVREEIQRDPGFILQTLGQYMDGLRHSGQHVREDALNFVKDETMRITAGKPGGTLFAVFSDYNCPYCRVFAKELDKVLKTNPSVRLVILDYPILGENSKEAAYVAAAAAQLDPAKSYALYQKAEGFKGKIGRNEMLGFAKDVGYDFDKISALSQTPQIAARINSTIELGGRDALAISGTPSYIVGDLLVRGEESADKIQERINGQVHGTTTSTPTEKTP